MLPTNASSFSELISKNQIIIYLVIAILNATLLFMASFKFILSMQQSGYKGKRFFQWVYNKETPYRVRLMLLFLMGFLFFIVLATCFTPILEKLNENASSYIGFVAYILFTIIYIDSERSVNAKIPLKITKRLVRLLITYSLVLIGVSFGIIILINYLAFVVGIELIAILRYALICLMPMLIPYLLQIANAINTPTELLIAGYHYRRGKDKLNKSNVIKIGITGSFGKTSVKEILKTILSQKYRVLSTPESYNTPLGIVISAKKLDSTHDIFIAEMGARNKGDIKALAELVKPTFGILTGINSQHLESFKTMENIQNTKYELFDYIYKHGGYAVFSADNEGSKMLASRYGSEKILAGRKADKGVHATDIEISKKGTKFKLNIKGEKPITCYTVLLGRHNITNICLAAALAYRIGLKPKEIAQGINRIKSVGHRLELLPNNKNIVTIDDSYNANVDGARAAMEVLDLFEGRKIVLTPGLIELGQEQNVANVEFGRILAEHVDIVIITGKHNAMMLINGLIEGGMEKENIIYAKNLKKGNEELNAILQKGDIVLFENDLPDNYN